MRDSSSSDLRSGECVSGGTRDKFFVYTVPSKKSVASVRLKVAQACHRETLRWEFEDLLKRINRILTGWANYFRHGVSKKIFASVDFYSWRRIWSWLKRKHGRLNVRALRRRFCDSRWDFIGNGVRLTGASAVTVERYRYRGSSIPTPWSQPQGLLRSPTG